MKFLKKESAISQYLGNFLYLEKKYCDLSSEAMKVGINTSKDLAELKKSLQKYGRSGHFSITRRRALSKNKETKLGVESLQKILGSLKFDGKSIFAGAEEALKNKKSDFYKKISKNRMFRGSLRRLRNKGNRLSHGSDGMYGDSTRLAVAYFQFKNSIKIDGAFGRNTLKTLESSEAFKACIKARKDLKISVSGKVKKERNLRPVVPAAGQAAQPKVSAAQPKVSAAQPKVSVVPVKVELEKKDVKREKQKEAIKKENTLIVDEIFNDSYIPFFDSADFDGKNLTFAVKKIITANYTNWGTQKFVLQNKDVLENKTYPKILNFISSENGRSLNLKLEIKKDKKGFLGFLNGEKLPDSVGDWGEKIRLQLQPVGKPEDIKNASKELTPKDIAEFTKTPAGRTTLRKYFLTKFGQFRIPKKYEKQKNSFINKLKLRDLVQKSAGEFPKEIWVIRNKGVPAKATLNEMGDDYIHKNSKKPFRLFHKDQIFYKDPTIRFNELKETYTREKKEKALEKLKELGLKINMDKLVNPNELSNLTGKEFQDFYKILISRVSESGIASADKKYFVNLPIFGGAFASKMLSEITGRRISSTSLREGESNLKSKVQGKDLDVAKKGVYKDKMKLILGENPVNFNDFIEKAGETMGIRGNYLELFRGIMALESKGNSMAISPSGPLGIMQMINALGNKNDSNKKGQINRFNKYESVLRGMDHLKSLIKLAKKNGYSIREVAQIYNFGQGDFALYKKGKKVLSRQARNYPDNIKKPYKSLFGKNFPEGILDKPHVQVKPLVIIKTLEKLIGGNKISAADVPKILGKLNIKLFSSAKKENETGIIGTGGEKGNRTYLEGIKKDVFLTVISFLRRLDKSHEITLTGGSEGPSHSIRTHGHNPGNAIDLKTVDSKRIRKFLLEKTAEKIFRRGKDKKTRKIIVSDEFKKGKIVRREYELNLQHPLQNFVIGNKIFRYGGDGNKYFVFGVNRGGKKFICYFDSESTHAHLEMIPWDEYNAKNRKEFIKKEGLNPNKSGYGVRGIWRKEVVDFMNSN